VKHLLLAGIACVALTTQANADDPHPCYGRWLNGDYWSDASPRGNFPLAPHFAAANLGSTDINDPMALIKPLASAA
jgi:hypothetical protein